MKIEQIYTSCLSQASYFISSDGEAAVIDPIREVGRYIKMAESTRCEIKYVNSIKSQRKRLQKAILSVLYQLMEIFLILVNVKLKLFILLGIHWKAAHL